MRATATSPTSRPEPLPGTSDALVVVTLRGEPEGKGRPRSRVVVPKNGAAPFVHIYTPAETRAYETALAYAARAAMKSRPPLEGALDVVVHVVMAVPASWSSKKRDAALAGVVRPTVTPDWDNFAKTLDALNEIVWLDDKQVVDGTVRKRYGEEPMMRIEVRPAQPFAMLL